MVEMPNGEATLEGSLVVTYKTKHTLITEFHNRTCYLPIGAENLCPHKKSACDVYSSFTHNSQNSEATENLSDPGLKPGI